MTAPEIVCIELVARARPGSVRVWGRVGELLRATCRDCGELTPAEELRPNRKSPGGREPWCLVCNRAANATYAATPRGREVKEASRRRGKETERDVARARARYAADPARAAEQLRRAQAVSPDGNRAAVRAVLDPEQRRAIVCVELVTSTRSKPGSIRVWDRSGDLLAGTCKDCREVVPSQMLVAHSRKAGGRSLLCRPCQAIENVRKYTDPASAAKISETRRRAYAADPEKVLTRMRAAYAADPEKFKERARERRDKDPDKYRAQARAKLARYAARTDAQIDADRKRLRPSDRKRCRDCRRALPFAAFASNVTNADGLTASCRTCDHKNDTWLAAALPSIERRDTWLCVYCGEAPAEHGDHVEPKARGGADDVENLIGACSKCNTSKNDRDLFDWRPDLAALVASWPVEYRQISA